MYDDETGQFGATISTLSMAVGLILIIACVNVAGLMLARGATAGRRAGDPRGDRRRTRAAGPAAAHREPAAGAGGRARRRAARLCVARLAGRAHSAVAARQFTGRDQRDRPRVRARSHGGHGAALRPGARAQAVARAELISTMLAVGGRSGAPLSKRAGSGSLASRWRSRWCSMTGAGLILRSFAKLVSVDLGFNTANVLTLEVEPLDQAALHPARLLRVAGRRAAAAAGSRLGRRDRSTRAGGGGSSPSRRRTPASTSTVRSAPCCPDTSRRWASAARGPSARGRRPRDRRCGGGQCHRRRSGTSAGTPSATRSDGRQESASACASSASCPDLRHGGPQGRVQPEIYVLPDPNGAGDVR